jgi:hypothetical protein
LIDTKDCIAAHHAANNNMTQLQVPKRRVLSWTPITQQLWEHAYKTTDELTYDRKDIPILNPNTIKQNDRLSESCLDRSSGAA